MSESDLYTLLSYDFNDSSQDLSRSFSVAPQFTDESGYDDLEFDDFLTHEYDMDPEPNEKTGCCLVFDSTTFNADCLPTRKGSSMDVNSIKKVFGDIFGFEVQVLQNKTKEQMEEELRAIGRRFKDPWRCFVCFFLSHGLGEKYLADFNGKRVNVHDIVRILDGDNCEQMVGKPKLYFAQMCRGFDREEYLRKQGKYDASSELELDEDISPVMSPRRDRLVCYATTPGRMAPMDPEKGSLFIQTLTQVLARTKESKSIDEIITIVTRLVDKHTDKEYKVCPVVESTLTGRLVFKPRPHTVSDVTLSFEDTVRRRVAGLTIAA